jgi:lipopolysaccharide transport system permease protein
VSDGPPFAPEESGAAREHDGQASSPVTAAATSPVLRSAEETVIQAGGGSFGAQLADLWAYRELLRILIWRELKVRYRQTLLGAGWILLQPLLTVIVMSAIFGVMLRVPSHGVPYPLFVLSALLPWNFFASSINRACHSLLSNAHIISKIYFPRILIPMAAVLAGLLDLLVGMLLLAGLLLAYGTVPSLRMLLLVPLSLMLAVVALAFSLWASAANVRYRDLSFVVPFVTQLWMYLTPVIYPIDLVPARYRTLLEINPMTPIVSVFRWAVTGDALSSPPLVTAMSLTLAGVLLLGGVMFFRRVDRKAAEIL